MAARVDLVGLKNAIKTVLDQNNTTTSSIIDLSSDLSNSNRVKQILTVHPEMIPIQASYYPYVAIYIGEKTIKRDAIATNQLQSKRQAQVQVKVVGGIYNTRTSSNLEDLADNDINYLMENIELILRSTADAGGKALWQIPESVEYFSASLNEKSHLRAGVLTLNATVAY